MAALETLGLSKAANVMQQLKAILQQPRAIPTAADYALRVIPHALGGATVGGISGALNAEEGERLRGAGSGALMGGLVGTGVGLGDAALMQYRGKGLADFIELEEKGRELDRKLYDRRIPEEERLVIEGLRNQVHRDAKDMLEANATQSLLAAPPATVAGSILAGSMAGLNTKRRESDRD